MLKQMQFLTDTTLIHCYYSIAEYLLKYDVASINKPYKSRSHTLYDE